MPSRFLVNMFKYLAVFFVGLYLLIWVASPWIIKSAAEAPLADLDYRLSEASNIRFNPFTFTLHLNDLGLQKTNAEKSVLSIAEGHINLNSLALLSQTIEIESFLLSDSDLQVVRTDEDLSVAGFSIAAGEEEVDEAPEEAQTPESESSENNAWQLALNTLLISNFTTHINDNGVEHRPQLKQLQLEGVVLSLNGQQGSLLLNAKINDAELAGDVNFELQNNKGSIHSALKLQNFNPNRLSYLSEGAVTQAEAEINLTLNSTIDLLEEGIGIKLKDSSVSVEALESITQDILIQANKLQFELPKAAITLGEADQTSLSIEGLLSLQGLNVAPAGSDNILLGTKSLQVEQISVVQAPGQEATVAIPNIELDLITFSKTADLPALFETQGLNVAGITASPSQAHVELISLEPFQSALHIDTEKQIANLVALAANDAAAEQEGEVLEGTETESSETESLEAAYQSKQTETHTEAEPPAFAWSFDLFKMTDKSAVSIVDNSISPAFKETYDIETLAFGPLASAQPNQPSPFNFAFKNGEYASGQLAGHLAPLAAKMNMDLEGKIREISLPNVSPYVRDAAGMDMLAGQLDTDIQLKIVEDEIDGNTNLMLRGLEVETAGDVKTGDVSEHAFIPLGLALGALKDSDGNIEMDIPLSGNVHDPDVGLNGFLYLVSQKAALAAAESYVINTFVPYANIVSLTKMAGEYALKVRIEDLNYQASQTELDDTQQPFVDGFIALMKEKPELQVKLCPFASPADLTSHPANLENQEDVEALKAVAKLRAETFKKEMIAKADIESARLVVCQAKIDGSESSQARIEFNI